ncbi:hypothetical protein AC249_AIPGENE7755, partial [Exaiptasia diaphana]
MTGLAWSDWINVREIYNESRIESKKRRKAEKKVAELARELHILENEKQPLVSERIVQLQSELQRIQHEREEVNRENVSLKNKLDEATSKLLAEQEFLSNQLDPLWESKPEELLKVFQQLTADLIEIVSNTELNVDVLIKVMQEIVKVLGRAPWHRLGGSTKISSMVTMMTLVTERAVNHPDLRGAEMIQVVMQEISKTFLELPRQWRLHGIEMQQISFVEKMMALVADRVIKLPVPMNTDVLIQVMQENTKVLEAIPWENINDGSVIKLIPRIETIMTSVANRLAKHPDLNTDKLIQVMQENIRVLLTLPSNELDDGNKMKLSSGMETMMTSVSQRLVNNPNLSTDALIRVMQENIRVLLTLPWNELDDGSKMKLSSGIETMMTLVAERIVKHPDLSTD